MKKKFVILSLLICVMVISIFLIGNYDNRSYEKASEEDTYFNTELALILVDEDGNETTTDSYPDSSEYYLNFAKSYCQNGSVIGWDTTNNKVKVTANKKDACKLYFTKGSNAVNPKEDILARNTLVTTEPNFSVDATDVNTNIYQSEDDLGTSYYFRGAPTNNYVEFGTYAEDTTLTSYDYESDEEKIVEVKAGAPMYWRIVRINGDGSIRLVYDGTEKVANGVAHTATIEHTAYNTNVDDAKYVGYTYESVDSEGATIQVDSTIKGVVDAWYDKHLETTYGKFVEDSIFCNDKSGETKEEGATYYAPVDRLEINKAPVLTCANKEDRYTMDDITNGNGYLSNPVGLLTADEAFMAGKISPGSYLHSGEAYWTSTSGYFVDGGVTIWYVAGHGLGDLDYGADFLFGARPVINLKADLLFTGTGKIDDPYLVAGFE